MGQTIHKTIGLSLNNQRTHSEIRHVDNPRISLLDLIFPKFCINCKRLGYSLCPKCLNKLENNKSDFPLCFVCENLCMNGTIHKACKSNSYLSKFFTTFFYAGIAKKILQLKSKNPTLIKYLLSHIEIAELKNRADFIIPIPPSPKYMSPRLIEPTNLISEYMSSALEIPIYRALFKPYNAKQQKKLNAAKRQNPNIFIKRDYLSLIRNKRILLIDDVCTTGSSINTSAKLLLQFGSKEVTAYTIARDLRYNKA